MDSRATQAALLDQRIAENSAAQQIDLAQWIFERVLVRPGDRVLELCCGTGGQTLTLLKLSGPSGRVFALDTSREALSILNSKACEFRNRLILLEANLDDAPGVLLRSCSERVRFDLVFCAYGLYYSARPQKTLDDARRLLKPGGRIVVVGPFGPNNRPLFDLVRASGAVVSESVFASSERFMSQTVLPWASDNFGSVDVHTMVNRVRWENAERVLNYWQNTTFYDSDKRPAFEANLHDHFQEHTHFVNEKWVMLVEMTHARR